MILEIERKVFIVLSDDFIFRIYTSPQQTCSFFPILCSNVLNFVEPTGLSPAGNQARLGFFLAHTQHTHTHTTHAHRHTGANTQTDTHTHTLTYTHSPQTTHTHTYTPTQTHTNAHTPHTTRAHKHTCRTGSNRRE